MGIQVIIQAYIVVLVTHVYLCVTGTGSCSPNNETLAPLDPFGEMFSPIPNVKNKNKMVA